jgi:menaquinone-dependent protoporphyrinogen IX oxidase
MVTDCNDSVSATVSNSEAGPPEARGPDDEITEIEEGLLHAFSSLLALAQEQHLSTVCKALSRLKQDTEECLASGCSPIFCPTFPTNARRAISELGFLLNLKEHTARLPLEELRTKAADLEKYLAYAEWDFKDSQVGFKNEAARLAGVYAMRVSQFVSEASEQLNDEIREQFRLLVEADRSERSDKMSSFVQARLQELLWNWQSPFEESSMELFRHAASRFAKHACELNSGIRSSVRSLFGCSAQTEGWCEDFDESDCFACLRDRAPDCFLSKTQFQFPAPHFRKHLLRNTLRNASSDLLGNASHAVEEHKSHLDKCCCDLLARMAEQLTQTKAGICDVVESALRKSEVRDKSGSARREREKSRNALDAIHRLAGGLDLLLCRWESIGDTGRDGRL